MANTQLDIDRMISDILKEEIEIKSKNIMEGMGEWTEIEVEEKLHGKQHKLDKNKNGKIDAEDFKLLRKKETKEDDFNSLVDADIEDEEERDSLEQGVYEEDGEFEEGNAFSGELAQARKEGKPSFKVGDKTFKTEPKEINNSLKLSESELIDMIEELVLEQKKNKEVKDKAEKQNISKKTPEGLKKTEKALKASKKENDDYAKEVVKKMKDYMKTGSKGEYTENPVDFPRSNFSLEKDPKVKKYTPSQAVDEYIEYFSYPGQTNLVFDEIKPDEKKIEKHLKGDRTMGNAQVDEEGNALGNVIPSKVGDRFFKNFQDNVYGNEQMKASYKRFPQPVEEEGEGKTTGSLKDMKKLSKGAKVLDKLSESTKNEKVINEMEQMKKLMSYNKKTQ
jgi:hypothetical protein